MNTKIKIIIAVIAIFTLTGIALGFYLNSRDIAQPQQVVIQEKNAEAIQITETQNPSIAFIDGEVTSFKDNQLEIKNGEIENSIILDERVSVYKTNGNENVKMEVTDLKEGENVEIGIDTRNSLATIIRIL